MSTAFSPRHGPRSLILPALTGSAPDVDAYFQDESRPGARDGSKVRAAWFNLVSMNLRALIRAADVTLDDSDPDMVRDAVLGLIAAHALAAIPPASDTVAGIVELATAAEIAAGSDTGRAPHAAAVKTAIDAAIAALVNGAPAALDTLNELAAALGNDANFAATVISALADKQAAHAMLTALAAVGSNGLISRTAANTVAARQIAGTANQISVTNGNGVSGNPTIAAVVASQVEAEAGSDNTKLMTPLRVLQSIAANTTGLSGDMGVAKVLGRISDAGAVGSPSRNISSASRPSTGVFTVNFGVTFANTNYVLLATSDGSGNTIVSCQSKTTSSCSIQTRHDNGSLQNTAFTLAAFGDVS